MQTDNPMFTIIDGHGDGNGVDGGTVFRLPASTFAAFPNTLLHDRTHRILQFRDPYLIQLPDCSLSSFTASSCPSTTRLSAIGTFQCISQSQRTSSCRPALSSAGSSRPWRSASRAATQEDADGEAGELTPHRINHDLQFLGIPSPFDPRAPASEPSTTWKTAMKDWSAESSPLCELAVGAPAHVCVAVPPRREFALIWDLKVSKLILLVEIVVLS
ncbi:hypothetical protein DFJ73DRAFT_801781 [Zopfochytrium polystomum]|nr:hypothetical protein DFJ73DRAFT_801781 [Zopfochytrium polystomum]